MDQTDIIVALVGLAGVVIAALVSYAVGEYRARQDVEIQQLKAQHDLQTQQLQFQQELQLEQLRVKQELQIEYDKTLRAHRIESYKGLLTHMRQLPKYPQPKALTYEELRTLADSFTDWYFSEAGGLFASTESRDYYFDLQDGIKIILLKQAGNWRLGRKKDEEMGAALKRKLDRTDGNWECPPQLIAIAKVTIRNAQNTDPLPTEVVSNLRELGSNLRTSMTHDVLTRRATLLQDSEPPNGSI